MPPMLGMAWRISSNTSATLAYDQSSPSLAAICWMIHRSWRACPGGSIAWRPSCTMRSVLVKVPVFSGNADAGSTTSAR